MKPSRALAAFTMVAACRGAAPVAVPAAPRSNLAVCAKVRGEVQVRRAGQPFFEALAAGAMLHGGDWVRTGQRSFARLAFLAGGELTLDAETAVAVDVSSVGVADGGAEARAEVALQGGAVSGSLGAPGAVPLVFRAEDGSRIRLSGTGASPLEYRIDARGQGLDVAVLRGEATLVVNGIERALHEGQLSAVLGGKLGGLGSLIEFPESVEPGIDARFLYRPDMRIQLGWSSVAGATGYRLQIARDLSFQDVDLALDGAATQVTFAPEGPGFYAWRVAARDGEKRLGEYGFARRIFCEAEIPRDLLLAPADGAALPTSAPTMAVEFSWQSAAAAKSYRILVAQAADLLHRPVVERIVADQHVRVSGLSPGSYFWGVYLDGTPPRPLFLQPHRFQVKKVAAARLETVRSISQWGE